MIITGPADFFPGRIEQNPESVIYSLHKGGERLERSIAEYDIKVALRDERDRLLEIKRVIPGEVTEAHRLIDKRLETIKESLES